VEAPTRFQCDSRFNAREGRKVLRSFRNPRESVVTVLKSAVVEFLIARLSAALGRPGASTIPGKCVGRAKR
jgi:hypothetical protein